MKLLHFADLHFRPHCFEGVFERDRQFNPSLVYPG